MERRLTAILAADVVGYSGLMERNEAATFERLRAHRKELFEPEIEQHHGRVFKLTGDGLLAEFASVVDAVECAAALQRGMIERNSGLPADQRIDVRIGLHVGDVIVENGDRHGDAVNVAARLEALAEPGGVCLSGKVHDEVIRKLDLAFDDLGVRHLKNLAVPVRVYRILPETPPVAAREPVGDRPSVAVLAFDNLSGDPEQQYFSDGITEDIITELSRFRSLFVIARNSSFQYHGKTISVQQIGRELGVSHVVEGTVRRSKNRVRITAQLLDAQTGAHLWADRYDREIDDIFAVQDEVVQSIVSVLPGRLEEAVADRMRRKPSTDLTAYDFLLRGESAMRHGGFGDREAFAMFGKALEIDPHCARAQSRMAYIYAYNVFRWSAPSEEAVRLARTHAERALALDDADASAHATAAWAYLVAGEFDLAELHSERAVALNPNDWLAATVRADVVTYVGDHQRGLEWVLTAMRLDPHYPVTRLEALVDAHYMMRQYEKALEAFKRWPNPPAHMAAVAAACYAQLERMDEALEAKRVYEAARPPDFDFTKYVAAHLRMCKRQEDREHWRDGYRKAGLPV